MPTEGMGRLGREAKAKPSELLAAGHVACSSWQKHAQSNHSPAWSRGAPYVTGLFALCLVGSAGFRLTLRSVQQYQNCHFSTFVCSSDKDNPKSKCKSKLTVTGSGYLQESWRERKGIWAMVGNRTLQSQFVRLNCCLPLWVKNLQELSLGLLIQMGFVSYDNSGHIGHIWWCIGRGWPPEKSH